MDNLLPKDDMLPDDDKNYKPIEYSNSSSYKLGKMLYTLPPMEYDIVQIASKGHDPHFITQYVINKVKEDKDHNIHDEESEIVKLALDGDDVNLYCLIKDYLDKPESIYLVDSLSDNFNNKNLRKDILENITYEINAELLSKIKRGELKDTPLTTLVQLNEKMLKVLHLEEDKSYNQTDDGIMTFKRLYEAQGIKPIVTLNNITNIYDKGFFGDDVANPGKYITPEEFIEAEYSLEEENEIKNKSTKKSK